MITESNNIENDLKTNYTDYLWNTKFAELKQFWEQHGHCNVPTGKGAYHTLAKWCVAQRTLRNTSPLKFLAYRMELLNSIGFCWNIHDKYFDKHFLNLKVYIKKYGHCEVTEKQDRALSRWCTKLRGERRKKDSRLTEIRIKRLDSIGFEWELLDSRWMKKYYTLEKYLENKKHYFDSKDNKKAKQLKRFISIQRINKKEGVLSKQKIDLLNKIGFIWDVLEYSWEKLFEDLKKYKQKFGHCNVSKSKRDKNYKELAEWVLAQRENYKKKSASLTKERINKLSNIGFLWKSTYLENFWEKQFEELNKYKNKFGHCNVTKGKRDKDYKELGEWVCDQRRYYRKKSASLTKERIKKLSEIGFLWESPFNPDEKISINDTDLLNELKRLQLLLNKTPGVADIKKYGKYSNVAYLRHFGNIRNARIKAGLEADVR